MPSKGRDSLLSLPDGPGCPDRLRGPGCYTLPDTPGYCTVGVPRACLHALGTARDAAPGRCNSTAARAAARAAEHLPGLSSSGRVWVGGIWPVCWPNPVTFRRVCQLSFRAQLTKNAERSDAVRDSGLQALPGALAARSVVNVARTQGFPRIPGCPARC